MYDIVCLWLNFSFLPLSRLHHPISENLFFNGEEDNIGLYRVDKRDDTYSLFTSNGEMSSENKSLKLENGILYIGDTLTCKKK